MTMVRQVQKHSIENLDRVITSWSEVTRLLALQVTRHPKEGEIVLRSMMSLHPEIIQIRIRSLNLSDELVSQNTSYPTLNLQIADSAWLHSKLDSVLNVAWFAQAASPRQIFVTRTQFRAQSIPFVLTVIWNAQRLVDIFSGMPYGQDYSVSIHSSSAMIIRNDSSYKLTKILSTFDKLDTSKSIQEGTAFWRILKSPFHSVDLWMVAAVPEKAKIDHVENLLIYSASLILGLMFVVFILGCLLSHQVKRYIKKLKRDESSVTDQ
jgi:hypothetical protein